MIPPPSVAAALSLLLAPSSPLYVAPLANVSALCPKSEFMRDALTGPAWGVRPFPGQSARGLVGLAHGDLCWEGQIPTVCVGV